MIMFMDPLAILLGISMGIDIGIFMFIGVVIFIGVVMFVMPTFSVWANPQKERINNIDSSVNPANTKFFILSFLTFLVNIVYPNLNLSREYSFRGILAYNDLY